MTTDSVEQPLADSSANTAHNDNLSEPSLISAPNARVAPTANNPHGYPPFNLRHVPTYTNNQLRYYHISGAMLNADKAELKRQMEERQTAIDLIN